MLSLTNILKTVIRRTDAFKLNGCRYRHSKLNCVAVGKMLETFEDFVFKTANKKSMSTMNYDKRIAVVQNDKYHMNNTNNYINNKNELDEQDVCKEYEAAVKALNALQSNAESLRSSTHKLKRLNSLQDTQRYLLKIGITTKDLEKLSYIHVAGTKGKGSTCALTEAILRSYGIRTGFYSSPHLVSLTERIRLNGQPIMKQKFTQYFWTVYNKLKASQEYDNDMPAYFKFLTILAFHVYLAEKVQVVILEVGIGGELDCTNVVPNTKTVGITSLGLEHTQLLGDTLQEIAWQKAGIIKPNSTVYTSVSQQECLEVIAKRAKEKQAKLYRVPGLELYFLDPKVKYVKEQINNCTALNGSLAVQLAYDWLRQNCNDGGHKEYGVNRPHLTEQTVKGILNCHWPGRCQKVKFFNFNIHLDGAHTLESMQVCGNWFNHATATSPSPKILIFNTTGDRDSKKLLTILRNFASFDLVCFTPNIASLGNTKNHDNQSVLCSHAEQLRRAQMHATNWQEICRDSKERNTAAKVFISTSTVQCFQHIRHVYDDKAQQLNILVTGSIHLIGATILSLNTLCSHFNEERA